MRYRNKTEMPENDVGIVTVRNLIAGKKKKRKPPPQNPGYTPIDKPWHGPERPWTGEDSFADGVAYGHDDIHNRTMNSESRNLDYVV